ncbi:MAG: hypothetical protein ROO76_12425 [Terriglobia bacterium]|jgi:hypothetical protein|nr:hypothetical protein [Terriglobia bacterium]
MRNLFAVMILSSVLCLSCSREPSPNTSHQNPEGSASPAAKSPDRSSENRHVYLSSTDLAKELREHCGKASDALNRAAALVSARMPDTKRLSVQMDDAKKSMSTCMTMVHGVEESALGAGAEQSSERK